MRASKAGVTLGALAVGAICYLLVRGRLVALVPAIRWAEYPFLILIVSLTLVYALRAPREERAASVFEWRRHAQVVRVLPDAELARLEDMLSAWLEHGAEPERVAEALARITDTPLDHARDAVAGAASRRDRLRLLNSAAHATRT